MWNSNKYVKKCYNHGIMFGQDMKKIGQNGDESQRTYL